MIRPGNLLPTMALTVVLCFSGCGDDGGGPSGPAPFNAIKLDLYDVGYLESGFFYGLWAGQADTGQSASQAATWKRLTEFNVSPVGGGLPDTLTLTNGQPITGNTLTGLVDFEQYDSLMVTIEASGSSPTTPSATVFLTMAIPDTLDSDGIERLNFAYAGDDFFMDEVNFYSLVTPTDADTANDLSGIWFVKQTAPVSQGLFLEMPPAGWRYEGWAWHDNTWLSTGKFSDPGAADDANNYSEDDNPAPAFPGEDFLVGDPPPSGVTFPWVFQGDLDSVAITLEPDPDPSAEGRFNLELLTDKLPAQLNPGMVRPLDPISEDAFPFGFLIFKRADDL